jgi:hypothetical protein
MKSGVYVVVKHCDKWVIMVEGRGFFTCRDRRTAVSTARHAEALLDEQRDQLEARRRRPRRPGDGPSLAEIPSGHEFQHQSQRDGLNPSSTEVA